MTGSELELDIWLAASSSVLMSIVMISSTVALLFFIRQVTGLSRQVVVTTVMMSGVYVTSHIPLLVSMLWRWAHFGKEQTTHVTAEHRLWVAAHFVLYLNSFSNPFVYYISCRSFREYLCDVYHDTVYAIRRRLSYLGDRQHLMEHSDDMMNQPWH